MNTKPRYLSKNASSPMISLGSGKYHGKVRWKVTGQNGGTIIASEYVEDTPSNREWINRMMAEVRAEQVAARGF